MFKVDYSHLTPLDFEFYHKLGTINNIGKVKKKL